MEHINKSFNICQFGHGFALDCWGVIKGQRMPAGYPEKGAIEITRGLTYEEAKDLANLLESEV